MRRMFAIGITVALILGVAYATTALADGRHDNTPARWSTDLTKPGAIVRQDLFDRRNPNNLRTDWPAPPSQPNQ
jgi:hypothetical protein